MSCKGTFLWQEQSAAEVCVCLGAGQKRNLRRESRGLGPLFKLKCDFCAKIAERKEKRRERKREQRKLTKEERKAKKEAKKAKRKERRLQRKRNQQEDELDEASDV